MKLCEHFHAELYLFATNNWDDGKSQFMAFLQTTPYR